MFFGHLEALRGAFSGKDGGRGLRGPHYVIKIDPVKEDCVFLEQKAALLSGSLVHKLLLALTS